MSQDTISDALNMIRNANRAGNSTIEIKRFSNLLIEVLKIMKQKGVIKKYKIDSKEKIVEVTIGDLIECRSIKPRFSVDRSQIEKYRRRYLPARNVGTIIISTNKGLKTHEEAEEEGIEEALWRFSIKMKIKFYKEVEIPNGMEADISGNVLTIKGAKGETKKKVNVKSISVKVHNGKIILGNDKASKKEKRLINTYMAHIRNIFHGLDKEFEYTLKVVYSHFPMTVELYGHEAIIKNFLGEKIPRKLKILNGVDVKINKENITVKSHDRELAGQTAANFEVATKIRNRDRRVFQDGIFITSKPGREI